jgi:hypothetical protein
MDRICVNNTHEKQRKEKEEKRTQYVCGQHSTIGFGMYLFDLLNNNSMARDRDGQTEERGKLATMAMASSSS